MSVTHLPPGKKASLASNDIADELKDLPDEVLSQLSLAAKKGKRINVLSQILERFNEIAKDTEEPLTLDDVIIEFYRRWGVTLRRNNISGALQKLANDKFISRPSKYTYSLAESEDD